MILFLQGASHSGKTTFAKHLARLTGASVVSLDLLKMGLIKSGNSDFAGLTPEDDTAIAERLWPIVREMALVADENGQSLIVEGVSLPFVEAGVLARELGEGRAAAFAVVFSEKYIRNHYELICQKASASERRVHQDPPALADSRTFPRKFSRRWPHNQRSLSGVKAQKSKRAKEQRIFGAAYSEEHVFRRQLGSQNP